MRTPIWPARPASRHTRRSRRAAVALCGLLVSGCLASSSPARSGGTADRGSAPDARRQLELCVQNDDRLPATVQLFRYGDPVGPPVHVEGFSRRCRTSGRSQMLGTLDVRVDPLAPDGTYFPESLRGILVTTATTAIEVTLVAEGIELYGQSSYRTWEG